MRMSISNMLGVLPPHYFDVTVSTVGEHLAQLMFSVIMTGALLLQHCQSAACMQVTHQLRWRERSQ